MNAAPTYQLYFWSESCWHTCRVFKSALEEARQSIVNRAKFVREAYGRVEADLDLVGATGIEDKLQEEVEETIAKLKVLIEMFGRFKSTIN